MKPNKADDDLKGYRSISFLSHLYKLLERVLFSRIDDAVVEKLPFTQACFPKGRSITDQVLRLVNDIEAAFQKKEEYGAVFMDLNAAYDAVWHRGLYLKLLKTLPDVKVVRFLMVLIQDRSFILDKLNGQRSKKRRLRIDLPQGFVLASVLFNIYTADMPIGICSQYTSADDSAFGIW